MDKLPIYKLVINGTTDDGVQANALVKDPAHGHNFLAFSKQEPEIPLTFSSDEKRMVTGPLLVPDQLIYRKDKTRGAYRVLFTAQDIEHIVKNFSKNLRFSNVNLEHAVPVEGVYQVESWLTGKGDKSTSLGFDVPQGTWMGTFHVESDELWKSIKEGVFKGFSVEGLFGMETVELSKIEEPEVSDETRFLEILRDDSLSDQEKREKVKELILTEKK